jgi:hypothetical protein
LDGAALLEAQPHVMAMSLDDAGLSNSLAGALFVLGEGKISLAVPKDVGVGAVREPPLLSLVPVRRFHPRLLTVFPLRGTGQRSNLFASP